MSKNAHNCWKRQFLTNQQTNEWTKKKKKKTQINFWTVYSLKNLGGKVLQFPQNN